MGVSVFIKLIEHERFNFTTVAAGSSLAQRRIRGIDMSRFSKGSLVVRVEDEDLATDCTIRVEVFPAWPIAVNPSLNYENASAAASVVLVSTSVADSIQSDELATQVGPALDLVITGARPVGGGNCNAMISVGLLAYE